MADQTAVAEQNEQAQQTENLHRIIHVEFPAANAAEAASFYGNLFGWKTVHDTNFDYWMWDAGDGTGGGFVSLGENQMMDQATKPGDVLLYISTPDINESLAKAEALGGRTIVPRMPIPGMGWFAVFTDPTGNRCGLFTTDSSAA